jgi:ABC-type uncharacterized transport system permease subunit
MTPKKTECFTATHAGSLAGSSQMDNFLRRFVIYRARAYETKPLVYLPFIAHVLFGKKIASRLLANIYLFWALIFLSVILDGFLMFRLCTLFSYHFRHNKLPLFYLFWALLFLSVILDVFLMFRLCILFSYHFRNNKLPLFYEMRPTLCFKIFLMYCAYMDADHIHS